MYPEVSPAGLDSVMTAAILTGGRHVAQRREGLKMATDSEFSPIPRGTLPIFVGEILVDLVGFEPTTSSMPWKRAPNCATGPLHEGKTASRDG